MRWIVLILFYFIMQASFTLFEFSKDVDLNSWTVVNDGVMGGLSKGRLAVSDEGYGIFQGVVSLENNGGFSLVQHRFQTLDISEYSLLVVRLKGDGKNYQVRLKARASDYYNYAMTIKTSGSWETISIPLKKMVPQFRGRFLDMPPFPGEQIEEVAFLIGNKKAEEFRLEIDSIDLK